MSLNLDGTNGPTYTLPTPVTTQMHAYSLTGLTLGAATPSKLVLQWTTEGINATQYLVKNNGQVVTTLSVPSSKVYTLTGLSASTTYPFVVTSVNAQGTPGDSASVTVSTLAAGAGPTPTQVVVSLASPTSAVITWQGPKSPDGTPLYDYTVTTTPNGGTASTSTVSGAFSTTIPVVSTIAYVFSVQAVGGTGSASATLSTGPTNVQVSSKTTTSVTLSWTAPVPAPASYTISGPMYNWNGQPGVTNTLNATTSATTYVVTGLNSGQTYTFTVASANGQAAPSISATPLGPVTGITFTQISGTSFVVSWSDPTGPATQYSVSNGTTTLVVTTPTATFTGLTAATTYTVTIASFGLSGTSYASTSSQVVTSPPALAGLTITSTYPPTATWTAIPNVTSYTVSYAATDGSSALSGDTTTTNSYTFTYASERGGIYSYSITPVAGTTQGTASTGTFTVAPDPVTGVSVSGITSTGVTLTISGGYWGVSNFIVSTSGGFSQSFPGLGVKPQKTQTVQPMVLTGLSPGQTYTFTVTPYAMDTITPGTAASSVPITTPPTAVSGVTLTNIGPTSVTINWSSGGTGATSFTISASDGTSQTATGSGYVYTNLNPGTAYTFTITPMVGTVSGSAVTSSSVTTQSPPLAVTGLTFSSIGTTSVTLNWSGGTTATSFVITYPGGTSQTATASGYTFTNLSAATQYTFTVTPYIGTLAGPATSGTIATQTLALSNPQVTSIGSTSVVLSWSGGTSTTTYTITASDGTSKTATASGYTYTGLAPNTTYTFTITPYVGTFVAGTSITTSSITTTIPPITSVTASATGPDRATVSWVGGTNASSYSVVAKVTAAPTASGVTVGTTYTQTLTSSGGTFTGLLAGLSYTFTVTPATGTASPASNAITTTSKPTSVTGMYTSYVGPYSAIINWSGGNGAWYYTVSNGSTIGPNTNTWNPGLAPRTSFTFTITPVGVTNGGSGTITFMTPPSNR